MLIRAFVLAVSVLASGCATQPAYQLVGRTNLTNADGHVVGHLHTFRDTRNSELSAQRVLYSQWTDEHGVVVGYEERVAGGAVLRDLHGKVVGERWMDMRSRGSNPGNSGPAVVFSE